MVNREREIENVAPERRDTWLATQIDEVNDDTTARLIGISEENREIKSEVAALRSVLTKVLLSAIAALIAVPVGLGFYIINHH